MTVDLLTFRITFFEKDDNRRTTVTNVHKLQVCIDFHLLRGYQEANFEVGRDEHTHRGGRGDTHRAGERSE